MEKNVEIQRNRGRHFFEFPNHFIAYVGVNGTVETALRELSEGVIEKLKRLTDAEFAELEFPLD